jgi:lipoate-protein ligase A
MHGEYKTPGGKLVRVDFNVRDGAVRDAVVSGDFFLYPEEALSDITRSLDGLPTNLGESEFAARIAAAIPPGTEWLGSSPVALATAVRRALAEAEVVNG